MVLQVTSDTQLAVISRATPLNSMLKILKIHKCMMYNSPRNSVCSLPHFTEFNERHFVATAVTNNYFKIFTLCLPIAFSSSRQFIASMCPLCITEFGYMQVKVIHREISKVISELCSTREFRHFDQSTVDSKANKIEYFFRTCLSTELTITTLT